MVSVNQTYSYVLTSAAFGESRVSRVDVVRSTGTLILPCNSPKAAPRRTPSMHLSTPTLPDGNFVRYCSIGDVAAPRFFTLEEVGADFGRSGSGSSNPCL